MTLPRALLVVLVLALLVTGAATAVSLARDGPRPRLAAAPPASSETPDPLAILHAWDVRRSAAWSDGDPRALRDLYVRGSVAGERDLAMLAAWRRRGLRVEGLRMQVLAVRVVGSSARRLVLAVTDRLAGGTAVGRHVHLTLPRDLPTSRRIVLRRTGGAWRVAAVRVDARRSAHAGYRRVGGAGRP